MKLADLIKAIDEVNASASKLGDRYQEVALHVLNHVQEHGDVGPANRLYLGMPKSTRRLAMGQFLVKYGKMKPNADRGTMQTMPLVFDKTKDGDMEGAKAKKWWEVNAEREITDVVDLQQMVKSLLNRCKDKTIKIGGQPMAPDAAKQTLKTIAMLAGLPVPSVEVDEKGVTHMADAAKVTEVTPPVQIPSAVVAGVEKMVEKAAEAAKDAANHADKESKATAKRTSVRGKAEKPTSGGRTAKRGTRAHA